MTTVSDAALAELLRPIIGIEHRDAQEAFGIMCDRIRSAFTTPEAPAVGTFAEAVEDIARRAEKCADIYADNAGKMNQGSASALRQFAHDIRALSPAPVEAGSGASGWRDIASAPKDGTRVLASGWAWGDQASNERIENLVHWDGEGWSTAFPGDPPDDRNRVYPPTHWQPLPAPPKPEGAA